MLSRFFQSISTRGNLRIMTVLLYPPIWVSISTLLCCCCTRSEQEDREEERAIKSKRSRRDLEINAPGNVGVLLYNTEYGDGGWREHLHPSVFTIVSTAALLSFVFCLSCRLFYLVYYIRDVT